MAGEPVPDRYLFRRLALVVIAAGLIVVLAVFAVDLHGQLDDASKALVPASAAQMTQLYVEALYKVAVTLGVGFAAYMAIRALD